jgi:glycosyltransferase involved in cell wall biosynthesis
LVKRRKIGLIYQYNENWIGGTYYIENLIAALNRLDDKQKPSLIIFTGNEDHFHKLSERISYPYLIRGNFQRELGFLEKMANKITGVAFGFHYFDSFHKNIDIIFPGAYETRFKKDQKFLYWIPDFQEHFLPAFFSAEEIKSRKDYQEKMVAGKKNILFSSESVKRHFNFIYPGNQMVQFVVPFAVTHSNLSDTKEILKKYHLPTNFFICSNQFWKHKNHEVILKAIHLLKKNGSDIFVVFTGKEYDHRAPTYFEDLKELAKELEVESNISFLGFIEREDQLTLMKQATAIIQPSLFEGWSTVIEDAKFLGKCIIASNIEVHKEQLDIYDCKFYFSANEEKQLAERILNLEKRDTFPERTSFNYEREIIKFANSFIKAIDSSV